MRRNQRHGARAAQKVRVPCSDIRVLASAAVHASGVVARSRNMSQLARDTGLTREGLYKALSDSGNPSFDTVLKVVRALCYRLTVTPESP